MNRAVLFVGSCERYASAFPVLEHTIVSIVADVQSLATEDDTAYLIIAPAETEPALRKLITHPLSVMQVFISDDPVIKQALHAEGNEGVFSYHVQSKFAEAMIIEHARNFIAFARARERSIRKEQELEDIISIQTTLNDELLDMGRELSMTQQSSIYTLAKMTEYRDAETGMHIQRMATYTDLIANVFAQRNAFKNTFTMSYLKTLSLSSMLHDIGKVAIPDSILLKPGSLTADEMAVMRTHAPIGGEILNHPLRDLPENKFFLMARDIATFHHEAYDGSGYPNGMRGEAIPLTARIVSLVDIYDACTSKRPYKEPFSHEKTREIVIAERGRKLDPDVVDAFLEREREIKAVKFP